MKKFFAVLAVIGLTVLLGSGCSSFSQEVGTDSQRSLEPDKQSLSGNSSMTESSSTSVPTTLNSIIAPDGTRYALIIGNGNYQKTTVLTNPATDATDIAKMLEDVGFTVTLQTDASLSQMEGTIREFADEAKASSAETTLFYYAGHGVQFEGVNYLLPVDADIQKDYELRSKAVSMELVSSALDGTDSDFNLILLDACRDNPFASSRGGARGLMAMGGGNPESMVVFSTSPGSVAQDGEGENSPFTTALKQNLNTPDQEVRQLVAAVSRSVQTMTKGQQVPWVNTSFTGSFYFVTSEQQLERSNAEAQRLKDELSTLESEVARLETAIASETDATVIQRLQVEQQRTQALEVAKRLESQKIEEMRKQAEELLSLQSKNFAIKREMDARMIGEQDALAAQASQRKAEIENLEQQRSQSTGAMGRLATIAKAELAVQTIGDSFAQSIEKAKREIAAMRSQLVDSYRTTNPQDPWETESEFNGRVTEYSGTLDRDNAARIRELEIRRDSEVQAIGVDLMKRELKGMRFTVGANIFVSRFEADNKRFPMKAVSLDANFPFEIPFVYAITSSDRDKLQQEYQRIDNADKAKALVGEMSYALKEEYLGIWSAYVVSGKVLNLLEGTADKPGVVWDLSKGTGPLGRDVFFFIESGEVRSPVAVTLDRQGGTGGSVAVPATYVLVMPSATAPTKFGYMFGGYYDAAGGIGTQYYTSAMASARNWDKTAAVTLYAKWIPLHTVTLDRQGGTGGSASVSMIYNSAMPIATAPTKTGYMFGGYYDAAGGIGTQYYTSAMASARNWDKRTAVTLYAKWKLPSLPLIYVEGGSFQMVSTSGYDDDKPVHQVSVDSFYLGTYEITQDIYEQVMGSNPSKWKGARLPVEQVSWYDAVVFCNALSRRDGLEEVYTINGKTVSCDWNKRGYRLPTEAEWEYAARGGAKSRGYTYAGSNSEGDVAWYGSNSGSRIHDVGGKKANELGLYDMSGNVYEWCWDWYGDYSASAETNPTGPSSGSDRVLRGGCWYSFAADVRSVYRYGGNPLYWRGSFGFRVSVPVV